MRSFYSSLYLRDGIMEKSRENHDVASFARFNPFDLKFICFLRLEKKGASLPGKDRIDGRWQRFRVERSRSRSIPRETEGKRGREKGKEIETSSSSPQRRRTNPRVALLEIASPPLYILFYLCRFLTRHLALSPRSLPLLFDNKRCACIELGNECRSPLFDYRALRSDQVNDLQSYLSFSSLNDRVLKYRFQR